LLALGRDRELAIGPGELEGGKTHADLLLTDAQQTAHGQDDAIDLVARAYDQITDGTVLVTLAPMSSPARYWLDVWPLKKVLEGIAVLACSFFGCSGLGPGPDQGPDQGPD
jgi:hypothetical protein